MILDGDIKVFSVTAKSFPDGVLETHQKLHSLVPFSTSRKYFGLSRPEDTGGIVYKAAAEELIQGEGERLQCETFVIKKGSYLCETIHDYMKDLPAIGRVFSEMISQQGIDPEGYCVEWYVSDKDVKCMVRLSSKQ
jgi:hypothetical protein